MSVLKEYAEPGDFIFLDPPYLPISEYSDFKRYTKEQFYEEDHVELAKEVKRLQELGCHVILTNSNHPLVHELSLIHISEPTRRVVISYAVFCLKKFFFNDTATTEIYTRLVVGSVRCV